MSYWLWQHIWKSRPLIFCSREPGLSIPYKSMRYILFLLCVLHMKLCGAFIKDVTDDFKYKGDWIDCVNSAGERIADGRWLFDGALLDLSPTWHTVYLNNSLRLPHYMATQRNRYTCCRTNECPAPEKRFTTEAQSWPDTLDWYPGNRKYHVLCLRASFLDIRWSSGNAHSTRIGLRMYCCFLWQDWRSQYNLGIQRIISLPCVWPPSDFPIRTLN